MDLSNLKPSDGAVKKRKRVARGEAGKGGKTAGRGHKGQNSRSGGKVRPGFEGGQMPLARRLPKRGFKNLFRKDYSIINLKDLGRLEVNGVVDAVELMKEKKVNKAKNGVKVLGVGEIKKALTVKAHKFSKSAKEKIEAGGGKVEVI
jgi:large subunit ribosomal protein L15